MELIRNSGCYEIELELIQRIIYYNICLIDTKVHARYNREDSSLYVDKALPIYDFFYFRTNLIVL